MFRFFHSADWQLGARFAQFGLRGARLREVRLETLQRALVLAREKSADAFLIAGDLFEDNQVADSLVDAVVELFRSHASVPIYILPGNHDPFTGPDCVWQRKAFLNSPSHVHVLRQPGVHDLGGAFLVASPLQQKLSTIDPSFRLVELATTLPADALRIGITHGALAIEGKHSPNDFPIALNAASRAGLDYLAIGHWHNWLPDTDGGRIVMPGTPEPDQFANERCGHIAFVEIERRGEVPRVQQLPVATLNWKTLAVDFLALEAARSSLTSTLAELRSTADRTVLRVTLSGTTSPRVLAETRMWLESSLQPFLIGQIIDETRIALSAVELADLKSRHPLLAQTLADIDRLESLATGTIASSTEGSNGVNGAATAPPLTLSEVQGLLGPAKIELGQLTPHFFSQLRQILLQTLQEVTT